MLSKDKLINQRNLFIITCRFVVLYAELFILLIISILL